MPLPPEAEAYWKSQQNHDKRRRTGYSVPWVTGALIGVTLLVFVLLQHGLTPGAITPTTLVRDGGVVRWPSTSLKSLVFATFLHVNMIHIGINMLSLFFVGRYVEEELSPTEYVLAYLIFGIMGNISSAFLEPTNVVSAGASGAIFGLVGLLIILWKHQRSLLANNGVRWLLMMLGINLVYDLLTPGIAIWAHFGGLFAGLGWGLIHHAVLNHRRQTRLATWRQETPKEVATPRPAWKWLTGGALGLLILATIYEFQFNKITLLSSKAANASLPRRKVTNAPTPSSKAPNVLSPSGEVSNASMQIGSGFNKSTFKLTGMGDSFSTGVIYNVLKNPVPFDTAQLQLLLQRRDGVGWATILRRVEYINPQDNMLETPFLIISAGIYHIIALNGNKVLTTSANFTVTAPSPSSSPSISPSASPSPSSSVSPSSSPSSSPSTSPAVSPSSPSDSSPSATQALVPFVTPHGSISINVPAGWSKAPLTGGDWSGWKFVNPQNPNEEVVIVSSGCVGCYYPSASTSATPDPELVIPVTNIVHQSLIANGLSDAYSFYLSGNPYEGHGIVTVSSDENGYGYAQVLVAPAQQTIAYEILDSFQLHL